MGVAWTAILLSAGCGVIGTGIGGILGSSCRLKAQTYGALLAFTAGLMQAIACFDMIPEAVALGGVLPSAIGCVVGAALVLTVAHHLTQAGSQRAGMLTWLALAAHNLPEGLCIGAGLSVMPALGLRLAAVIAVHDVAEGMAVAAPLHRSGLSRGRAALASVLSGSTTVVGAWIGALMGGISEPIAAGLLALAAGAMTATVTDALVPEAAAQGRFTLWQLLGCLAGFLITGI